MRNLRLSQGELTAIGCYTNLFIFVMHDTHDTHLARINLFTHHNCVYALQPVILVIAEHFVSNQFTHHNFIYAVQPVILMIRAARFVYAIRDTSDTQFTLLKSGYAS